MIVATFNVENLFERPRAMNLPNWREGQPALNAAHELNALFNQSVYSPAHQRRMLQLLKKFGLTAVHPNSAFLTLGAADRTKALGRRRFKIENLS